MAKITLPRQLHERYYLGVTALDARAAAFSDLEAFLSRVFINAESDAYEVFLAMDLSFSQARTLFTLAQTDDPLPIGEIAQLVSLSVASAGRNVDQLVKLGLVERDESEHDRRVKLVTLTTKGRDLARAHLDAKRGSVRAMLDRLEPGQCERLSAALAPLLELTKDDLHD